MRTLAAVVLVLVERNGQIGIGIDEALELGEGGKGRAGGVARGWVEIEFADRQVRLWEGERNVGTFGKDLTLDLGEAECNMAVWSQLDGT